MIPAIGAIGYDCDSEYMQIIREMQRLGLTPSGNKYVDKAKLNREKERLAEKFAIKEQQDKVESNQNDSERAKLEEERLGAMTIAQLNRVLLGI